MSTKEKSYINGGGNCCIRVVSQYPCQSLLCAELDYDGNVIERELPIGYKPTDSNSSIELFPRVGGVSEETYGKQLGNAAPCVLSISVNNLSSKDFRYSYCNKCESLNGIYKVYKLPIGHYQSLLPLPQYDYTCLKGYEAVSGSVNFKFSDIWFGYLCSTQTKLEDVCGYHGILFFLYLDSSDNIYAACGILNRNRDFYSSSSPYLKINFLRKSLIGSLSYPSNYNRLNVYNSYYNNFSNLNCLNIDNLILDEPISEEEFNNIDLNQIFLNGNNIGNPGDINGVNKISSLFTYGKDSFVDCESGDLTYSINKVSDDINDSLKNLAASIVYVKSGFPFENFTNIYEEPQIIDAPSDGEPYLTFRLTDNQLLYNHNYDYEISVNYPYDEYVFSYSYYTRYDRPLSIEIKPSVIELEIMGISDNDCLECEKINGKHILHHTNTYDAFSGGNFNQYTTGGSLFFGIADDTFTSSFFGTTGIYPRYSKLFIEQNLDLYEDEDYNSNQIVCSNCVSCGPYFNIITATTYFHGNLNQLIFEIKFTNLNNNNTPIKYRYNLGDNATIFYEDSFEISNFTNLEVSGTTCNINEENFTSKFSDYKRLNKNYDYKIPCVPEDYPCSLCYASEPPSNVIINFPNNWRTSYVGSNCNEYELISYCNTGYPYYTTFAKRYRYGMLPLCDSCGIYNENINGPVGDYILSRSVFQGNDINNFSYKIPSDLIKNVLLNKNCDRNNNYYSNVNEYHNSCVWSYINNSNIKQDGYNKRFNSESSKLCNSNGYTIITDYPDYNHSYCDFDLITFKMYPYITRGYTNYSFEGRYFIFEVKIVKFPKRGIKNPFFHSNKTISGDWIRTCDDYNESDLSYDNYPYNGWQSVFHKKVKVPQINDLSTGFNYIGDNIVVYKRNTTLQFYIDLKNISNLELNCEYNNNSCGSSDELCNYEGEFSSLLNNIGQTIAWGRAYTTRDLNAHPGSFNGSSSINARYALDNLKETVCNYPGIPYEINKYMLGTGCSDIDGSETDSVKITLSSL